MLRRSPSATPNPGLKPGVWWNKKAGGGVWRRGANSDHNTIASDRELGPRSMMPPAATRAESRDDPPVRPPTPESTWECVGIRRSMRAHNGSRKSLPATITLDGCNTVGRQPPESSEYECRCSVCMPETIPTHPWRNRNGHIAYSTTRAWMFCRHGRQFNATILPTGGHFSTTA